MIRTVRQFHISKFQNVHANWLRLTTMLSERIVNQHLRPLTSDSREDCFVIDDTLYERAGYKRTELAARVFDHVGMRFRKGFRLLTLGWTDGCMNIPPERNRLSGHMETANPRMETAASVIT